MAVQQLAERCCGHVPEQATVQIEGRGFCAPVARKRGVDVRVIIPTKNNHGIMNSGNKVSANRLIKNGVRVYLHPKMTHVKAAIYDGWVCFGTANYDKLSLAVNREINLATVDPDVADRLLNELFYPDMEAATELTDKRDLTVMDHIVELISDET